MIETAKTLVFAAATFARPALGRRHMAAYQLKRLQRLVRFVTKEVPWYRERYRAAGVDIEHIRSLGDMARLPELQKPDLRALGEGLEGRSDLISHKTSGSTGIPTCIYRSHSEERRLNLFRWRLRRAHGLRPGDRLAHVKTVWEPLPEQYERMARTSARFGLVDRRQFDCLQSPEVLRESLLDFKPSLLAGYPSALVKLARQFESSGANPLDLRCLFTGGERLAPHQRAILEQVFDAPVVNCYGTVECNLVAWQCRETDHFHVCDDNVLLEVCRDGVPVAPGEEGDVLVTVLHSRNLPLIRYNLGDRAIAGDSQCACGQPFSTIKSLEGRVMEYLKMPDGTPFHPLRLANEIIVTGYDWIAEYQMIQEALDRFRLLIVPRRGVGQAEEQAMRAALTPQLGPEVHLQIEWVDDIPPEDNGKYRFCRTLI